MGVYKYFLVGCFLIICVLDGASTHSSHHSSSSRSELDSLEKLARRLVEISDRRESVSNDVWKRSKLLSLLSELVNEDTEVGSERTQGRRNIPGEYGVKREPEMQKVVNTRTLTDQKEMEKFKMKYDVFHRMLQTFTTQLATKFRSDAPKELKYVTVVTEILVAGDPDFYNGNFMNVARKWNKLTQVVNKLLTGKTSTYLKEDPKTWFTPEGLKLDFMMRHLGQSPIVKTYIDGQDPGKGIGIGGPDDQRLSAEEYRRAMELNSLLSVI